MDHHMPVKHNEIHANVKWHILLSLKLAISVNTLHMWGDLLIYLALYLKSAYPSVYLLNDMKGYN